MKKVFIFLGILIFAFAILSNMSFSDSVEKKVVANVYVDGIKVDKTTITIKGKKHNWLFSDKQTFIGLFDIDCYEYPGEGVQDIQAKIRWDAESQEMQIIYYIQNATASFLDLSGKIMIDNQMNEIALGFLNGTIVATSENMYNQYKKELSDRGQPQ